MENDKIEHTNPQSTVTTFDCRYFSLWPRAKRVETHHKNTHFFPVILAEMEPVAKWMPVSPFPYPMLMFRITRELYKLVFRPRQLWIEGGEGSYNLCLEEMVVWRKSWKIHGTVSTATGNGNVPTSISDLLTAHNSNYDLRGDALLKLPNVNSTKYGIKSWRYQAARLWDTIGVFTWRH